ncbi:heavy-metal-associated domain-containing protein [Pectinatus sottacetonis]|uniref:heavy-metal-associated domain-containing protein n=1 Tax=Pectinatus sottacetonis TaxID=1002795 RepID=UPI0018C50657|nr:heavy-metal-associated domain-containing protein [Pectinatus sottacetonis]
MLKIYIKNMDSSHSMSRIIAALGDLEGMHKIQEANLAENYISVECSTNENTLRAAIKDEGYNVTKIEEY